MMKLKKKKSKASFNQNLSRQLGNTICHEDLSSTDVEETLKCLTARYFAPLALRQQFSL